MAIRRTATEMRHSDEAVRARLRKTLAEIDEKMRGVTEAEVEAMLAAREPGEA